MRRITVGIGIIVISLLLITQMTMAEQDGTNSTYYDIYTKIDIDTTGALTVNEAMTINLTQRQGNYIKQLDISNVSGVKDLTVSIITANGETEMLEPAESMDELQASQFYAETIYEDRIKMNLYVPVAPYVDDNHQLKMNLQYTVTDLVSIYNDTAYFEWLVLLNGNEALQNFMLDITYPQAINEEIKPMLSGAFYQREIKRDDWTTRIISTHVKANEEVTFSVLLPATFCLDSRKRIDSERVEQITADQTQQKIEQKENEVQHQTSIKIEKMLSGGPIVLLLITTLFLYFVYGRQIRFKESQQYKGKIPIYHSPAELAHQSGKRVRVIDLFSTLLDLCNQHILEYRTMNGEIAFVLKNSEKAQQLKRHERYLINWLFNAHDTERITWAAVLAILEKDHKAHKKAKFKTWARTVHKQTSQLVKGEGIIVARIIGIIITLLNIIFSAILIFQKGDIIWASGVIGSSLLLLMYACSLLTYNEKEKICWLEWDSVLKFLKEIKKGNNQSIEYSQWEKFFPYAVSLNQTKPVITQMESMLDTQQVKEINVFKERESIELIKNSIKKIKIKSN